MRKKQPSLLELIPEKDYEFYYTFAEHFHMTVTEYLTHILKRELERIEQPGGIDSFFRTLEEWHKEAKSKGLTLMKYLDQQFIEEYLAMHKA